MQLLPKFVTALTDLSYRHMWNSSRSCIATADDLKKPHIILNKQHEIEPMVCLVSDLSNPVGVNSDCGNLKYWLCCSWRL